MSHDVSRRSDAADGMPIPVPPGSSSRFLVIALTAFLTVVDLFATQAILPSLTRAYGVSPAAMGSAVNASTIGMAIAGSASRSSAGRSIAGSAFWSACVVLAIPTALLASAPNLAVFTAAARRAGPVHGDGLHADARLSRRTSERGRFRDGFGRLHHRQCREQFRRPVRLRGGRRSFRARVELLFLRCSQPRRRRARLFHRAARAARALPRAHRGNPVRLVGAAPAQSAAARGLRYRLLHPVRLHRHLHLRQFRAGAPAVHDRPDGARLRLFRVPALGDHDAVGGTRRRPARHDERRSGARSASPAPACRCCSSRASPPCSPGSSSSASAPSSPRRWRPATSAAPRRPTAAPRAARRSSFFLRAPGPRLSSSSA